MDAEATQVLARTGDFPTSGGAMPQWEHDARRRLTAAIERFSGPLGELLERDANEGDTRFLVTDFLSEGLGYDKYADLTTEYRTSGESVDYGISVGGRLLAFIEVKRCGQDLDARNLRQAKLQALEGDVAWVVLTNGRVWRLHHIDGTAGDSRLLLETDLLDEESPEATVDAMFHLTREAAEHGRLDGLRRWHETLDARPLADTVLSEAVVEAVRAEIRRSTGHPGHTGDTAELARALRERVVARGLLD